MSEMIVQNLLSPAVLFFALGLAAALCKSDLRFPKGLNEALSMYLLIAIGLKGGIALSHYEIGTVIRPIAGALSIGVLIPVLMFTVSRYLGLDLKNAAGLSATYGSVSIVTYGAAVSFLEKSGVSYEGFMNALVVLMESPAIFVSLLLLNMVEKQELPYASAQNIRIVAPAWVDRDVLRDSMLGKGVLLLGGSLLIGFLLGDRAIPAVKPLFIDLYNSVLILFLLSMGIVTGQRLPEVRKHGSKLLLLGILAPLVFGSLGVLVGSLAGLSAGGIMLMGVLAGSASYIAAPAALKASVPEANPSLYLGLSLGVTFPFNIIIGIPIYHHLAQWISL